MRAVLSVLCALALATGASAQVRSLADADLPRGVTEQLQAVIDDPATVRFDGSGFIHSWETITSSVAAFDGLLTVAGQVDGDVLVVNGDLEFESGAAVAGNVTVVAGSLRGAELAAIGGTITIYGEGFSLYRRGERLVSTSRRRWRDRADREYRDRGRWGRSDFVVRIGENYNRVEGLPLQFGPDIWTGGRSPFHVQALAVWRTATGNPFDTREMGYVARAEQFLGPSLRVGASLRSTIQPIENWALSDTEASLAAALFHEDFRDYYERTGWSAYVRLRPRRSPLDVTFEYRNEDHETAPVRDPWTLFDRQDVWRAQPLAAEGNIQLLTGSTELDFTRGSDFRRRGWLLRSVVNHRLDGSLTVPGGNTSAPPVHFNRSFTSGLVDVRRYQRVGWDATLGLRAVAGGSAQAEPLPPQFQHALGGAGSLPGYPAFSVDCGARNTPVRRAVDDDDEQFFFPSYGCDRFALVQAEYRGGFGLRFGGHNPRNEHDWGWHVDSSINWIVFFDAARAWSYAQSDAFDTGTLYDVGGGVILGGLGIYGAVPLNGDDRKLNLFVRLGPRF